MEEETATAAAPTASAAPSAPNSSGTTTSDIAKVPQKMFSNERQTSDKCRSCSKDWKNWYYPKKRRHK